MGIVSPHLNVLQQDISHSIASLGGGHGICFEGAGEEEGVLKTLPELQRGKRSRRRRPSSLRVDWACFLG